MKFTTVRLEGSIFTADILEKIAQEELKGQVPGDFGLKKGTKVKDEIAAAWADAQDLWRIFKRHQDRVNSDKSGVTETRKFWMIPFLGFLGYDAQFSSKAEIVNNQTYAISHRDEGLKGFPIHIMGFNDSLDRKREEGGPRMSPHGLVQEYLNLTEHLYAIVTNGIYLRVLRDSSRLVKLSFIEFDLRTMMEDEHYADFALMFRLLHASRMPQTPDEGPVSLIEAYHQDSLDSGARIREGLSDAVETAIKTLADGFLIHPANTLLREEIEQEKLTPNEFYQYMLRLIYRLLFLMVIEERHLIYPEGVDRRNQDIYYNYYSVTQLRKRCETLRHLQDTNSDLWVGLLHTFRLFEDEKKGKFLDIKPLAGDLFDPNAIGVFKQCRLENKVLLEALKRLSLFENKNTGQLMRINYGSLNVEEFGSVYEGLLEYAPAFGTEKTRRAFQFVRGTERSTSGSHYTPDELVQPLIKHSLDHVIEEKLKQEKKEEALKSITVCDVACGSGHILLNAARRIGTELARVRTGEEQPSPTPLRKGIRDTIRNCIYGVDKNPLAVELCKVALWLEAHNPGEPLNFLDHHIKCGDSIVGLAHMEELEKGIADEAFKTLPGDTKEVAQEFARLNKKQKKEKLALLNFDQAVKLPMHDIAEIFKQFNSLPENAPEEVENKRKEYIHLTSEAQFVRVKSLADIQVAQFFIPKTEENMQKLITDAGYRKYFSGYELVESEQAIAALAEAQKRRFFHWFLEFPDVFAKGGFDCILGNPPYLGGKKISGMYGDNYLNYLKHNFQFVLGQSDYVVYFLRRIYNILCFNGFLSLITTNTISQGDTRQSGLDFILESKGNINFVSKSIKWPGIASLMVSLLSIKKGEFSGLRILNGEKVPFISSYFDVDTLVTPYKLNRNIDKSFKGSDIFGEGFMLEYTEVQELIDKNKKNEDILFPFITGNDLTQKFDQIPSRWVINFFDWSLEKAKEYEECFKIVLDKVKPVRDKTKRKSNRENWWHYAEKRPKLYRKIKKLKRVLAISQITKFPSFSFLPNGLVYSTGMIIFPYESYSFFANLQSSIHYEWARKYSSTLETRLRYAPSDCFETFPFPQNLSEEMENELERIGEEYHEFRRQIMLILELGLTKTYNLFHSKDLTSEQIKKESKKDQDTCETALQDILKLRQLHKQMDEAVLKAYGWTDINLAHDFYEVDYLPENDRVRFTISPEARKQILKRLLELNHHIHEQEVKAGLFKNKDKGSKKPEENTGDETEFKLVPENQSQENIEFTQKRLEFKEKE
ncbi:MAG: N-6 DNA methylase [Candidatus Aminicenantes bacterium]|nr:N-6 DNA methylase [Candidatus Aminicenantes bacterium]NIM84198.1 N-6 DNA methylase [Candidatus Aminicenantes bacterium]NIN23647.1 N-6 DNA methylase [Candidatus Aminicenantes bacterium]NIN47354.1 N-6 DNA methylase [Candidatus Aminicenantes bacterium]NIN90282.1 N-6 DNA methylase [Candidatus Aminicenantes bacterium]